MKDDIADLFAKSQVADLDYREITAVGRGDDAMGRWSVLKKTYELLTKGGPSARPLAGGAADLFTQEGGS